MKKRIFVAYSTKQENVAKELQNGLKRNFDVFLWKEAKWSGGTLLDNIIDEIHRCEYGLALLSCDDECHAADETSWLPRNNVALELGYFFSHYPPACIAIVAIKEPDGRIPSIPSDLRGWLNIELSSSKSAKSIKEACDKISARFQRKEAEIILSVSPRGSVKRGFNVLKIEDALLRWGNFEGDFSCVNPSWKLEQSQAAWLQAHAVRYRNPKFLSASYVIDIDRGRDASASNGKARVSNDTDDLRGIVEFADLLIGQFSDLAPIIEKKMRIHIRPGVRSQLTSFVGTLDGTQRGFLFVRPYNNDRTVLEARSPVDVVGMSDHVRNLIAGKEHFTLSEARALKDRLVHGSVKRTV